MVHRTYGLFWKHLTRLSARACLLSFLCLSVYRQNSLHTSSGRSQTSEIDKDPIAVLELGAATSWIVRGGAVTFAPNFAAEVTPIENWLELEAGVSPFYTWHSTEWDTDLLFKKSWTLSASQSSCLAPAAMGLSQAKCENVQLAFRGSSGRFHVLADWKTPRLVSPTCLRL